MLQGMSAGYMAVVMTMYLTETLPPEIRGRGTGVFQFFLGLGLVVAAAAGCLIAVKYGAADAKGLAAEGILPGGLGVQRVAKLLYNRRHIDERPETREQRLVCAYAFAAAENNAACGIVVTAPTCGACAVLPAVMKYMQEKHNLSDDRIVDALAVGGIIGNVVKQNASISGAECGCQAEIGTACSMTAAALGELFEMDIDQIEYAAEMSLEHMLGLTCDPICGLVQIPCIERNAVAAMRAINSVSMANFLMGTRKISFDMVVRTMYETGRDLHPTYRETSTGGLAKLKL
jgi:L-serine dehydratase